MKRLNILIGFTFLALLLVVSPTVIAQPLSTFEVGEGTINGYTTTATGATPFTTIMFDGVFASPPNVFTMTPEFPGADDPCTIRIRNITTTSFDATCLEPLNEDRNSPAIPFEYIAVQNGGVTVPLASGSGSVVFQSSCQFITNQQGRGVTSSFADFNFNSAFSTVPALIAQVQTTINTVQGSATTPGGEPTFLDVSVTNVTTSDADIAIELSETTTTNLSNGETICVLAVERNNCQSLDFSSLGGPAMPVAFQALTSGAIIQGHDNMPCDSVGLANGCFASTPIVLAKQNSRNGPDGGFLRRCDVSTNAATFIYDEDRVGDIERSHAGSEAISILAFSELFTTPVTLTGARVNRVGRNAIFNWETSAETFHLGFNLWGETDDGWVQLNAGLIRGNGVDSGETQSYRQRVRLTREQRNEITQYGISSVDNTGYEEFYGPFAVGEYYGEEANSEPVDWTSTRAAFDQSMRDLGYVKYNNRWFRVNDRIQALVKDFDLGVSRTHFEVSVDEPGIHSITGSELLALNPSWNNLLLSSLAITLNGDGVSRHVISNDNRLSSDDKIVFNAAKVSGDDTPFIDSYTYRISADPTRAYDASEFDGSDADIADLEEFALISKTATQRRLHSAGLTTGDPWYDARLLSTGRPASANYTVDFDYSIDSQQGGVLDVVLFGSLDLPDEQDDHHVRISVNEQVVSDFTFDGLVGYRDQIQLPENLLLDQGNIVTVTVVGDTGLFADVVLVDEVTLSGYSSLANPSRTRFDFPEQADAQGYRVNASGDVQVYAYTESGLLSVVEARQTDDAVLFESLPFEASESSGLTLRYAVADQWPSPSRLDVVDGQDLHTQETDYLIVAHPTFMGETLNEFVEFKTELGHNVRVVDWLELVQSYGYGNNTPKALNNFLDAASELYQIDNVLIVGGHTFDYFGITNEEIVNFIPSHYKRVSVFEYTATDNPYADLDGDNIPEIAIGRWPVRSVEELRTIINKTTVWHNNREDDPYLSAFLVAQSEDGQSLSFTDQLASRVNGPLSQLLEFESVEQLDLESLPDTVTNVVSHTREQLSGQINSGTELVSFSGHASQTAWGFQNIINTDFIRGLENQGQPTLLMPLACYITHYEDVSTNTLAHQWLFAGEQGAVAIHGASVLGEYRENGLFAERYINNSKEVDTVGQAILKAKQASGENNEILHNWILLGDPALPIR